MRNTALVLVATLASSGCIFVNENVGDHVDGGPPADAPTGGPADAAPDADIGACQALACPSPDPGRFMICGRIIDVETSEPIVGPTAQSLKVSFYEALAFANNAETPPEFTVHPDPCGRFVSKIVGHEGVAVPGTMYIVVGVDDADAPFPGGNFATTVVPVPGVPGGKVTGFHAYATREATDGAWSGSTVPSVVQQGVFAGIFIDTSKAHVGIYNGAPTAGVELTVAGALDVVRDFYFDDTAPLERSHVGDLTTTGANGTVLYRPATPGDLETYGAIGGSGCTWPEELGTTVPNAVWVSEREGVCP
jgi:hypothetical protein